MKTFKEFTEKKVYTPKELELLQQLPIRKMIREYSDSMNPNFNEVEKSKAYQRFFTFLLADQYVNHKLDAHIIKTIHERFLSTPVPDNAKLSDYKIKQLYMSETEYKKMMDSLPKNIFGEFVKEHPQWTYQTIRYSIVSKKYKITDFIKYYESRI